MTRPMKKEPTKPKPSDHSKKKKDSVSVKTIDSVALTTEMARVRSLQQPLGHTHSKDDSGKENVPTGTTRRRSKKYSFNKGRIRVKLNQPEAADQSVVIAEAESFTVKNRLMNLMGSSKIRALDERYYHTLYNQLSHEEMNKFENRVRKREKIENTRLRKLVIDGELEADEMMLNHPVVRVAQTIRRLDAVNKKFFETGNVCTAKAAVLTPIEPFSEDESGGHFMTYPYHVSHRRTFSKSEEGENEDEENIDDAKESEIDKIEEVESDESGGEDDSGDEKADSELEILFEPQSRVDFDEKAEELEADEAPKKKCNVCIAPEPIKCSTTVDGVTRCTTLKSSTPSPIHNHSNCIISLFDETTFATESLQKIFRDFKTAISADEKSRREFSAEASQNYRDSFVKELENYEKSQPEIFQFANKITKFYERKQRTADDKLRKMRIERVQTRKSLARVKS